MAKRDGRHERPGGRRGPAAALQRGAEALRSRLLYRSLDAAMTASLRPRRGALRHLKSLLDPRVSNYDRVASLVGLCDAIVPGTAERATRTICRPVKLPLDFERMDLMAYGSGSTVFGLEGPGGRRVLKFYRRSLGRGRASLEELAGWYRGKYETMRAWYAEAPDLVWPSEFLIVPGPIRGRPAVACLQDRLEGPLRDFFQDFTDDELVELFRGDDGLRSRFLVLARRTVEIRRRESLCPDFLGRHNLALAGRGPQRRLILTDYGIFDLRDRRQSGRAAARLERCVDRLESLLGRVAGAVPGGTSGGMGHRS